jgi:hypothetical protein
LTPPTDAQLDAGDRADRPKRPSESELDAADPADRRTRPSESELDAAIGAINDPDRLREAQELVARAAPALQRVLATAIAEGGWFDLAHEQAVREAVGAEDPQERTRAIRTLLAEETRLGMLVGVAIGFELFRELGLAEGVSPARP